ncbi:transposase family protein [Salmonella enterica subsp. enterica serovar Saintpaul]|nr:transposase family protein [Salmonella enterica subsp. enterica serovar Saintpaul]EHG4394322.1 transposase family protein [Salmonella enterica subsp. enterica serovar Saintpaul]EJI6541249.1 transposase family protein [Salmonella enterica]
MGTRRKTLPTDALLQLRRRLDALPPASPERTAQVVAMAQLYGVSESTVYRGLKTISRPRSAHRKDRGRARVLPDAELTHWCEIIAALKLRTTNKSGRHLSTARAIQLLEEHGVETPQGLEKVTPGLLKRPTVDRHLSRLHLDQPRLQREPPAVRFQAEHSNDCWQFDMSPSDLKHIDKPEWIDPDRGTPTLMLYSAVDDRSGVVYQEYRCVYGEDAESALRFLFNAMAPKAGTERALQGRPRMIYLDNGPVAKSSVFVRVMEELGIDWKTHIPKGKDGTRTTARSKGKVERPFRTIKEAHEVLYHFHRPETEQQANEWLWHYLNSYNAQQHREEKHSRIDDWVKNLPAEGFREMCSWEQYCRFAREPEVRRVGADARVSVSGVAWEVDPDLAGEKVRLLWGLFDNEIYVEFEDRRLGPYAPVSGPVPLNHYRKFRRGRVAEQGDKIRQLAEQLNLPISALSGTDIVMAPGDETNVLPRQPFDVPEYHPVFRSMVEARVAIAAELALPLARLGPEAIGFIEQTLNETLVRDEVIARIRHYFRNNKPGEENAG